MAQTPAQYVSQGNALDYTPGSAVIAGQVVVLGTNLVTIAPLAIEANKLGSVATRGLWDVPKDDSNIAAGDPLYWDDNANPVTGTAGSGAFTSNSALGPFAGFAVAAAGTSVDTVRLELRSVDAATVPGSFAAVPVQTAAAANSAQNNGTALDDGFTLVTAADGTKAVVLPEAAPGKICILKNSAGSVLKVFPAVADSINGASANAVYNQAASSYRTYVAYNNVAWYTDPETIA